MKRRSFLKTMGLVAGAPLIPKGNTMPQMGDLFAKLALGQQLTSGEIEQLRLGMNQQQQMTSTVAGLVNPDGSLNLDFLPVRLLYSKTITETTASIRVKIPSDINNVIMFGSTRTDNNDSYDYNKLIVNDDEGENYHVQEIYGADDAEEARQVSGITYLAFGGSVGATGAANHAAYWFAVIPNIRSKFYKGSLLITGGKWSATKNIVATASSWRVSTDAIKTLVFKPGAGTNFIAGSSFAILGIV